MPSQYASLQDFDDCGLPLAALASIDKTLIQRQLVRASAFADGFIADTITQPIVGAPDQALVMAVCQIAAWWIIVRRGFNPTDEGDKVVRQGFLDATAWLVRVANKQVKLNVQQSQPNSLQPAVSSNPVRGYGSVGIGGTDDPNVPGFSNWGS